MTHFSRGTPGDTQRQRSGPIAKIWRRNLTRAERLVAREEERLRPGPPPGRSFRRVGRKRGEGSELRRLDEREVVGILRLPGWTVLERRTMRRIEEIRREVDRHDREEQKPANVELRGVNPRKESREGASRMFGRDPLDVPGTAFALSHDLHTGAMDRPAAAAERSHRVKTQ